jgi:hypothetical protein
MHLRRHIRGVFALAAAAMLCVSASGECRDGSERDPSQIERGEVVPQSVHFNLAGKNREFVGLVSYSPPGSAYCATPLRNCRSDSTQWS